MTSQLHDLIPLIRCLDSMSIKIYPPFLEIAKKNPFFSAEIQKGSFYIICNSPFTNPSLFFYADKLAIDKFEPQFIDLLKPIIVEQLTKRAIIQAANFTKKNKFPYAGKLRLKFFDVNPVNV